MRDLTILYVTRHSLHGTDNVIDKPFPQIKLVLSEAVTLSLGTHIITANITDGNGKMTSITRTVTVLAPPVAKYCRAGGTTSRLWIESVSVAGITNTSGSQGGYGDFTGLGPIYLDRAADAGLTRMRVMMTRRDNAEPCQNSRASEVEDYTVVLLP